MIELDLELCTIFIKLCQHDNLGHGNEATLASSIATELTKTTRSVPTRSSVHHSQVLAILNSSVIIF